MELLSLTGENRTAFEKKRLHKIGEYSHSRFKDKEREPLDTQEELSTYLEKLHWIDFQNAQTYYEDLSLEPLPEGLSAYTIVPVAAGQEIGTLQRTLDQYAKQDADPNTWALMLFVNYTDTAHVQYDDIEKTQRIIDTFVEAHPELSIRVTGTTYADKAPPIGSIRADAWDAAIYDVIQNDAAHEHLIGISHDADTVWLSPDYISKMQHAAQATPQADLTTCHLSWHQEGHYQSDANKLLRYWEYLHHTQRTKRHEIISSDANTAIRLASYAAIGGFKRNVVLAEMVDIRERLNAARYFSYDSSEGLHYIDGIRLKTDSRRIYRAIAAGHSPDNAWSSLPFLTGDDPVRSLDTTELAGLPVDPLRLQKILTVMEHHTLDKLNIVDKVRLRNVGRSIIQLPAA